MTNVPKAEIEDILEEFKERLEEKYGLKSLIIVVGSVKRNLVTVDENGHFDLDYNLCFIKVPQEVRDNLQGLKDRVRSNVRRHIVGGENRTLISALLSSRLCRTGTCRRLSVG